MTEMDRERDKEIKKERERKRDFQVVNWLIVLGICERKCGNQCFITWIWERTPIEKITLYKIISAYGDNDDHQ